jgi:uncharacterized protein (DUF1697 family)
MRPLTKSSRRSGPPSVHVALLRGINVGGKNMIPMAGLKDIFVGLGCDGVRNYIQSGNIVFCSSESVAERVPRLVSKAILDRFGHRVPVVLRAAADIQRVVSENPFAESEIDPAFLSVGFLADLPEKSGIAALDPDRSPGDSFRMQGREIYLHCPNGAADTRFTNQYFDSTLTTTSTFRNWRTVLTLLEMTQSTG